ncbi:adenine deaminase [Pedosphaera parvula]|uniref:Adenine deaminase n=1 Tax=Pedosphaera parvula (strain Ellin514) TaxID=320771 RepID=B9XL02_PEDPL|nr:adenine deaminase [Pedosphaera parvula]EEF59496.1 adenine deaminase [Pedosphaera parvula Ellin514]
MRHLQEKLSIARGEKPAELLFKNANLVNVLSGEIHRTNVAVTDGRVVGIGDYEGEQVIDLKGAYLAPSLIDGHFHVESSMLTMPEFARAVVPHGTGVVVIDPHEYANVLGLDGIRYVLESSKNLPIDFFIMLPSCVPATHLETAGARLTADDLKLMIADERVAGVAELMNYPGVYLGVESELDKIKAGKGKAIDGHAPGLRGKNLNAYVLAGVKSDHESTELEEAHEKLRLGMHLLLREGSTERNLATLAPLVNPHNAMNLSYATDDKLAGDLVSEGHIDHAVRKSIQMGVSPITALQIATINTARHYRLRNYGAIAPRYWADFIVFDDLKNIVVRQTYKKGILVAENGKYFGEHPEIVPQPRSTMNLRYKPSDLEVKAEKPGRIRVIEIVPQQIVTKELLETPKVENGKIVADVERDILKMVVVERHRATGNVGVGFVRGFKLKQGALGSTVAHDAHNVVVVGTNDEDILKVIQELENLKGGQVAVSQGQVKAELALPIAGLVSDQPLDEVIDRIAGLNAAAAEMGCELEAPFMTLSFLSLSPIPELKLTDQGLIDAVHMRTTSLFE